MDRRGRASGRPRPPAGRRGFAARRGGYRWRLRDRGHGPVLDSPRAVLDFYITHRAERLAEIRAALAAGDRTKAQIVARVYADVDRALWPFAEISVRAQLAYLADRGELPADMPHPT